MLFSDNSKNVLIQIHLMNNFKDILQNILIQFQFSKFLCHITEWLHW